MSTPTALIGAHVSIAKGMHLAFARGESIGCTALQIFTKSSRAFLGNPLKQEDIDLFIETQKKSTIQSVIAHAGYLINLCAKNATTEQQSIDSLENEIERCAQLQIPYLVLHPGAHLGIGEEQGLQKVAHNLDTALEKTSAAVSVLLETTAGQGTTLGSTFEQLKTIRNVCTHKKRIGFCLDTCHIFCAGYDISTPELYKKVITEFDNVIGLTHLKAIHLNNTKDNCGAHTDRHTPIEQGNITLQTFKAIMNDKQLANVPKILETPTDDDMKLWADEIELLTKK